MKTGDGVNEQKEKNMPFLCISCRHIYTRTRIYLYYRAKIITDQNMKRRLKKNMTELLFFAAPS